MIETPIARLKRILRAKAPAPGTPLVVEQRREEMEKVALWYFPGFITI